MDTISSPTRLPTEPCVPSPIDLVGDAAATHVAVDVTTELRWFFDGPLPQGVLSWFTRDDTAGLAESRWDSYRDDASDDVGIKRRFGASQIAIANMPRSFSTHAVPYSS